MVQYSARNLYSPATFVWCHFIHSHEEQTTSTEYFGWCKLCFRKCVETFPNCPTTIIVSHILSGPFKFWIDLNLTLWMSPIATLWSGSVIRFRETSDPVLRPIVTKFCRNVARCRLMFSWNFGDGRTMGTDLASWLPKITQLLHYQSHRPSTLLTGELVDVDGFRCAHHSATRQNKPDEYTTSYDRITSTNSDQGSDVPRQQRTLCGWNIVLHYGDRRMSRVNSATPLICSRSR